VGAFGRYRRKILKARGELSKAPRTRGPRITVSPRRIRHHDSLMLGLAKRMVALFRRTPQPKRTP
jgi:hypothetical protein